MGLKNTRVLLVEDDPIFRGLLAHFLTDRGACVIEAGDGVEGLRQFGQTQVDIVLADLNMPNLGGLDMLKTMAKLDPKIPSIVISANDAMADVTEALRMGASDYLVKPIGDLFSVEQAITQCLRQLVPQSLLADFDQLPISELLEHIELLDKNKSLVKQIHKQLLPVSPITYPKARIEYQFAEDSGCCPYFIDSIMADNQCLHMCMVYLPNGGKYGVLVGLLLRVLINQELKSWDDFSDFSTLQLNTLLVTLNEYLVKMDLGMSVDLVYLIADLATKQIKIARAGNRLKCFVQTEESSIPLKFSESLQLGIVNWINPATQSIHLDCLQSLCITNSNKQVQLASAEYSRLIIQD